MLNNVKDLRNPRILAVLFMGFSSGLPLVLTSSTLQAWFTTAGVSLVAIGALSFMGLPYVWKFLWAPFLDRFNLPWGGRRKGWIALLQAALCIMLWLLANRDPLSQTKMMAIMALTIAFLSASQDTVIDAYRTDSLLQKERGIGSAIYIFAARIAILIAGGLALVLADHWGWRLTYQFMAGLMAFACATTYFAPRLSDEAAPLNKGFTATVIKPFAELLQRDGIILILLFVVLYKFGDALALSLMSNFLLRGLHFSLTDVGIAYKTVSLLATLTGAFLGGALLMRITLFRALLYFGLAQAFSNLMFMLLAIVGKQYGLMVASIFIENFCSGMSTAAFMAFLMSLCHRHYSATQYACLAALSAIGRVFLGPVAALMVQYIGWVSFYGWSFIICFPGIILLGVMRSRVNFNEEAVEY